MPWNATPNGSNAASAPLPVLIAAPAGKAQALYNAFSGDGRFHVQAMATSPQDVTVKLSMNPQALVLDGLLYDGPDEIIAALNSFPGCCIVLLPVGVDHTAVADIERLPCVAKVVQGETDFPALTGIVYEQVQQQQSSVGGGMNGMTALSARPVATSGWRSIAVWNLQGGVGKSTVSAALALEAASRRLPTLLVGLGAPDPLPLSLGLHPEPNLQSWRNRPTLDGLKGAVQSYDSLDLLAGFPSPLELTAYLPDALEGEASLSRLAGTAAYAGYAVVVLDVSSPELAAAALAASNALVLVGLATLPGILATVEAVRLATETLSGRHSLPASAIHLVLNRVRAATFSPEEVVQNGSKLLKTFPPLAAVVRDDPTIEESLNLRRPAYYHSDTLRQAARSLGDLLFAAPAQSSVQRQGQVGQPSKVYSLGPIRVRV